MTNNRRGITACVAYWTSRRNTALEDSIRLTPTENRRASPSQTGSNNSRYVEADLVSHEENKHHAQLMPC